MLRKLGVILRMIKVEHTLFAMPFLYAGAVLAERGVPDSWTLLWITVGLFSARTAAMCLNRLIDREIDARNPRTSGRALPRGLISPGEVWVVVGVSLALLLLAAAMLNPLCVKLYPLAVGIIWLYPYTKRFTWLSHLVLGSALAIAPFGAYVAVTASISIEALLLAAAVVFWVAGFDIIYATQDVEFDRREGLHSIPARFGIPGALKISAAFHCATLLFLLLLYFVSPLEEVYLLGLVVMGALLAYEHAIVSPENLEKVGVAFFRVNALFSLVLFTSIAADMLVW
ncbi:MAG: UbiA family prenyltransferase [Euryarchaeota archaeon]|nr:UbiA family prenyltransferase [Euryarchaeota archaeon]